MFGIFVLLIFQLGQGVSETIRCERFGRRAWKHLGGQRVCFMQKTSQINSADTTISPTDTSVRGLDLNGNGKISFLPIGLDVTFPNLVVHDAYALSLKTVSKINFKNLKKLKYLSLRGNQLESINSDTFEDLTSLEYLDLGSYFWFTHTKKNQKHGSHLDHMAYFQSFFAQIFLHTLVLPGFFLATP